MQKCEKYVNVEEYIVVFYGSLCRLIRFSVDNLFVFQILDMIFSKIFI